MFCITITEKGGKTSVREFDKPEVTIGRVQGNDIMLPKSNISKRHARVINKGGSFVVVDTKSTNGTYINGKRINAPYDLRGGDKIFVGDFTLEVKQGSPKEPPAEKPRPPSPPPDVDEVAANDPAPEGELVADGEWAGDGELGDEWSGDWGGDFDAADAADMAEPDNFADADLVPGEAGAAQNPEASPRPKSKRPEAANKEARPKERAKEPGRTAPLPPKPRAPHKPLAVSGEDAQTLAMQMLHRRIMQTLDLRDPAAQGISEAELKSRATDAVREVVKAMDAGGELPRGVNTKALTDTALKEVVGLGPLEPLRRDETVERILVNAPSKVYAEREGTLEATDITFSCDEAVLGLIDRLLSPLGVFIDERAPIGEARLKDGTRVNAVIPPLAVRGPTVIIRKLPSEPRLIDDLVAGGALTADMAEFLETCVRGQRNVVVSGPAGSGTTTTLNVLCGFIPSGERVITIEHMAELTLDHEHVIGLEARPPVGDGAGAVSVRDLVRNALRMRPDRIVVGDCSGAEAIDLLQAMATTQRGALCSMHAESPQDALGRLHTMVLMGGVDLPDRALRDQISSAVDLLVHLARMRDGSRRITHVCEVVAADGEALALKDVFVFEQRAPDAEGRVTGRFRATGKIPSFYEGLKELGIDVDLSIFQGG